MKATSVRFGSDLWEFLRYEAEHSGVSVSQYIREAALARAAAAASARGEDPFLLLSGTAGTAGTADRANRSPAERAVETAGRNRDDARALRAQSKQAVRHTMELATRRDAARAGRSKRPSPKRTA